MRVQGVRILSRILLLEMWTYDLHHLCERFQLTMYDKSPIEIDFKKRLKYKHFLNFKKISTFLTYFFDVKLFFQL